ncbi:hypothetical protein KEM48_010738 [Puccinia striiformis f. sp. tritici PST-130]|nr:hypothetical protein KEM48_010738 [Puccinia striiformis f. sp. tritici PST-130]
MQPVNREAIARPTKAHSDALSTSSAVLYHGDAGLVFTRASSIGEYIAPAGNNARAMDTLRTGAPSRPRGAQDKRQGANLPLKGKSQAGSYRPGSSGYLKGKLQAKSYQPGSSGHVSSKVGQAGSKLDQHVIRVDSVDPVVSSRRDMADRGRAVGHWLWRVYTYNPTFPPLVNRVLETHFCRCLIMLSLLYISLFLLVLILHDPGPAHCPHE